MLIAERSPETFLTLNKQLYTKSIFLKENSIIQYKKGNKNISESIMCNFALPCSFSFVLKVILKLHIILDIIHNPHNCAIILLCVEKNSNNQNHCQKFLQ